MKMAIVREPARGTPVVAEVEVLVVGAGPAGVGAAVRAAREGARTLLVESQGMLGGAWTSSMQVHATSFFSGGRVIVGGLVKRSSMGSQARATQKCQRKRSANFRRDRKSVV